MYSVQLYQKSGKHGAVPKFGRVWVGACRDKEKKRLIWGCGDHSRFQRKTGRQATGIWVYVRGYRYAYNGLPIPQKQGFVARF